MDNKTFNEIIDERIKLSRDGLVKKAVLLTFQAIHTA